MKTDAYPSVQTTHTLHHSEQSAEHSFAHSAITAACASPAYLHTR
jgi:hypothetical protein